MKIKRLMAAAAAAVTAVFCTLTAFAETGEIPAENITGETEHDVTGTFDEAKEPEKIYSVDIEWGSMNFTYKEPGKGVWNPETHEYTDPVNGGWRCDKDTNKIMLTNHSNAAVGAEITFAPNETYGIAAEFTFDGTSDSKVNLTLETADAYTSGEEQYPAGARSEVLYFNITAGELPENAADAELGEITIILEEA